MADFVAVLKKTIEGLGETTPEVRAKVYDKARGTISAKLDAIKPPPPAAVAERQRKALEDAIKEIERSFAPKGKAEGADPLAELDALFAELSPSKTKAATARTSEVAKAAPFAPAGAAAASGGKAATVAPKREPAARSVETTIAKPEPARPNGHAAAPIAEPETAAEPEADLDEAKADEFVAPPVRRRGGLGLAIAALALVLVAGAGYAAWLNRDSFGEIFADLQARLTGPETPATPERPTPPQQTAAAPADSAPAVEADQPAPKFTQRLNADGSEVDPGPAGGTPSVGEGTAVAAATRPGTDPASAPAAEGDATTAFPAPEEDGEGEAGDAAQGGDTVATAEQPAPAAEPAAADSVVQTPANAPSEAAIPVGQKAIFYEERTSTAQGSAENGSVVWSVVQESPGNDLPPEPAVRAEATVPGKDIQLRMTIRRNGDQTLPASHIIELIFLTPGDFGDGGIENVLRMTMKDTEQAAGNPLLGIPVKIADGFFLVALDEGTAAVNTNTTLLRRQRWIDIPMVYKSGRRALITMEKGIPGDKVFDEVMRAWQGPTEAPAQPADPGAPAEPAAPEANNG